MFFSRKRYRPLDSAEERAVHANQRVQLLPLEDEQSYCFSWPEAPLTQWLQENANYATLYQLSANIGGGGTGSGGSSSNSDAHMTRNLADGIAGGRRDALGHTGANKLYSLAASAAAGTESSAARRQVDLPPVLTLEGAFASLPQRAISVAPNGRHAFHLESEACPQGDDDVRALLRRLRHDIDAVDRTARSTIASEASTSRSVAAPPASIDVAADAPRAVPHPLAPPRPQSITEDSIFTLSYAQLLDLADAGVPALCAAAEAFYASPKAQPRPMEGVEDSVKAHPDKDELLLSSSSASAPAVVVVIEEEAGTEAPQHAGEKADFHGNSCGGALHTHPSHPSPSPSLSFGLPEAHRQAIEEEVVGLEWRTWMQSQRTAAALQRLLSLEAAVPYEPSGDAHRDAWRVVVYRLWLRWRQQVPQGAVSTATATTASKPFSSHSTLSPEMASAAAAALPSAAWTVTSPQSLLQASRLPWGAPLLAGAYLYGTSNDYFISLPSSAASAGAGGSSSGTFASPASAAAAGASVWPAMSRRRGAYNFLRWKVELYEAQMPQAGADGDDDDADSDGEDADALLRPHEEGERDSVVAMDDGGESDLAARGGRAKISKYAKGPLGQTDSLPSGRPKRRGVQSAISASAAASSSSSAVPSGAATRRATSARAVAAAAPSVESRQPPHRSLHTMMSAAHIKALVQTTVLTQPLTELQMDDEPGAVMERLTCPDLRHETDAWRVWLSKV
ncbi:hypothetical protein N2W54_002526 [Lotmaria passim]